jgi:hypothetical protein
MAWHGLTLRSTNPAPSWARRHDLPGRPDSFAAGNQRQLPELVVESERNVFIAMIAIAAISRSWAES